MSKFNRDETLDKYIKENDKKQLQVVITSLISIDRDFKDKLFNNALSYVEENFGEIYESYDERGLISDTKEKFTDADFNLALARLELNFCQERINDVKKISEQLYGCTHDISEESMDDKKKVILTKEKQSKTTLTSKAEKIGVMEWILIGIGAVATVITIVKIVNQLKK